MVKALNYLTNIGKYLSMIALVFISVLTFVSVIMRFLNSPILGDVELVQLAMVVVIMGGLAYTQEKEGHIAVDILVDKFPVKIQGILDLISKFLTVIVTFMVAYIYLLVFFKHLNETVLKTTLLGIVYYPFDLIIVVGFLTWGLQALLQFIKKIIQIKNNDW